MFHHFNIFKQWLKLIILFLCTLIYVPSDEQVESNDDNNWLNIGSKKEGEKTKWTEEMLNDFIDIIVSSEYTKKKLIFMNTKTQRSGEIYDNILKAMRQEESKHSIYCATTRSKFKKCVGICKQAAMTRTKVLDSGSMTCTAL